MPALARRRNRSTNIWPGFVDAIATLLMVVIFLLMIFVLAQFFLGDAISGRDEALKKLQTRIAEMSDLLDMERTTNENMRINVAQLSDELQASVKTSDDLKSSLALMTEKSDAAEQAVIDLTDKLDVSNETVEEKNKELIALIQSVAAMRALRDEMKSEIANKDKALSGEKELSEAARAELALANRQMAALRDQLAELSKALDVAERKASEQGVQISSMGKRLNSALASKVQELSLYRSEFFGRLREVLGSQPGVRVVGDRFVFQSEVLFETGSADLGESGQAQMRKLAATLRDIQKRIPKDIDWILRIDGHTDKVPISNWKFPSNWELSSGRAISVVKFLKKEGVPASRLAATGFGEFQPIDTAKDDIANKRNRRIEMKLTQR
ncbi:MAG: peptidoglycan -binding protein [Rhodospirillaceae bacterium]|nr:peptidoglycan -binding protein [Rhodospirillaceae bacterium]